MNPSGPGAVTGASSLLGPVDPPRESSTRGGSVALRRALSSQDASQVNAR